MISVQRKGSSNNKSLANNMEDLKFLKENLNAALELMTRQAKHEDVAIFIGSTKAGKSTTINHLMGNKLVCRKDDQGGNMFNPLKIHKGENTEGPDIGCGPTSVTTTPSRWIASQRFSKLIMWDCPGFCDNRGPVQSITNAYYIYHLFQNIKSVKIVLVIDINDIIQDRINSFITLLSSVENVLREKMRESFSSIVVLFTKVPKFIDDQPVNKNFIKEVLMYQILSSTSINISAIGRDFAQYLTNNTQNIGILRKAASGSINNEIEDGVVEVIQNMNSIQNETLKQVLFPSIDSDSKIFLYEIREELSSAKTFNELLTVVKEVFKDMLTEFSEVKSKKLSREELIARKEGLCSIRNQIESSCDSSVTLYTKIDTIQMIDHKIKSKIVSSGIVKKLKMMEFIDGLLDLKQSDICNLNLQSIMETVGSTMSKLIIDLQYNLHEIDINEAIAERKRIEKKYEQDIKKVISELEKTNEHNKDIAKKLGFCAQVGHAIDTSIESVKAYFSSWF